MRLVIQSLIAALLLVPVGAYAMGGMGGMDSSSSPKPDPQKAYQDGVAALNAHDYKAAIKHLNEAHDALPRDGAVNYALGLAYVGNNDPKGAKKPLERAIDADEPNPDAFLQLGLVYLQLGKPDDAADTQKKLSDELAKCASGCGAERKAGLQTALDSLNRAMQSGAPAAGKPQGWNFPDEKTGRAAYAEAVGLINQHRYQEALVVLAKAETAVGPQPDIFNYMGFANRHLKRYDAAISYYRQALALEPNHIGANEYLGELYLELGQTERAKAQLARLDELCPFGCAAREELARWITTAQK